jgi:CRISPR system Cascade subunit CasB
MHRLVAPWLPPAATEETQRAYYAVASMIADQPRSRLAGSHPGPDDSDSAPEANATTGGGNAPQRYGTSLGLSFALAVAGGPTRDREMRATTAETRLNLLTRQSAAGLYRHLPASVRYLRQLDTPIDWAQLLDDLLAWPQHSGRIARRWLQDYYRTRSEQDRRAADQDDEAEQQNENNTTIDTP